ncbi:MAG: class I lanthipeptide [Candidatus Aminicenantes bacterium]|nr:MAG: class I lanthipeptide [Candidatus Aminicenantes bacterium]
MKVKKIKKKLTLKRVTITCLDNNESDKVKGGTGLTICTCKSGCQTGCLSDCEPTLCVFCG